MAAGSRIKVSPDWISEDGRWTTRTGRPSNHDGRFSFQVRHMSGRLMTLDASREHAAVVTFDTKAAKKPLILKLRPTTLVRAAISNEEPGREIDQVHVSFPPQETRMAGAPPTGLARPSA